MTKNEQDTQKSIKQIADEKKQKGKIVEISYHNITIERKE